MHKKGYTLIELLVVIAVLALLMGLLIPVLGKAKRRAAHLVCQSNLRDFGALFHAYAEDNDNRFFAGYYEYTDAEGQQHTCSRRDLWAVAMEPYYQDPKVMLCPLADKKLAYISSFSAWGEPDNLPFFGSYGLNAWLCDPPSFVLTSEGHDLSKSWRRSDVSGSSRIPVLADSVWECGRPEEEDLPPDYEAQPWYDVGGKYVNHLRRWCPNRHEGAVNVLFLDGSARPTAIKQLWTLKWHREFRPQTISHWPEWMNSLPEKP